VIPEQPVDHKSDKANLTEPALQDVFLAQPALLVGVIATLTGSALQEEIVQTIRQLHHRGQAILDPTFGIATKGTDDADQAGVMSGATAAGARAVQLGRSAVGAHGIHTPV
jgi:hypothetical protein